MAVRVDKKDPLDTKSHAGLFAIAVLLLVISSGWAVWDEVYGRRPWKAFQATFAEQAIPMLESELASARTTLEESEEYKGIQSRLEEAKQAASSSEEYPAIRDELDSIEGQLGELRDEFTRYRGDYQADVYLMELTDDEGARRKLLASVEQLEEHASSVSGQMHQLTERRSELRQRQRELRSDTEEIETELTALEEPVRILERRLQSVRTDKVEIRQRINPALGIIDRCEVCHVAAAREGFEEMDQPFQSHSDVVTLPSLDQGPDKKLLSVHDVERFGCTPCHRGQGYATTTTEKAHGAVHHWNEPMLEGQMIYASCLDCHLREAYVEGADALNEGRWLVYDLGCFGCHNFGEYVEPFGTPEQIGPNLQEIKSKVNPDWLMSWIEDPKGYNKYTKMPDFRFEEEDIRAISAYLWQASDTTAPTPDQLPHDEANIPDGDLLFATRGCLGCHEVTGPGEDFAPDLSRAGEKLNYEYLVSWILDPRHLQPRGEMPMLVSDPEEAAKIAAYLLSRNEAPVPDGSRPSGARRSVSLEGEDSTARGKRLVRVYNCYGCHETPGFEDAETVVPDIYTIGSKPIERFDFGLLEEQILHDGELHDPKENVGKARELWIRAKLEDPRVFDQGKYKKPDEELRMPDYQLSEEAVGQLTTLLVGMTGETVPESYRRSPGRVERVADHGRITFRNHRCYACHGEGGAGGVINPDYLAETIPALNALAEVMKLYEKEDADSIVDILERKVPLEAMLNDPPVRRFAVVVAQNDAIRETIRKGSRAGRADSEGRDPMYHMPSWNRTLSEGEINDLMVYLLMEYPWEDE